MEVLTVKLAICRLGKNKFHVNYYFSGFTARRQASLANQNYAEGVAQVEIFWNYGTSKGLFKNACLKGEMYKSTQHLLCIFSKSYIFYDYILVNLNMNGNCIPYQKALIKTFHSSFLNIKLPL